MGSCASVDTTFYDSNPNIKKFRTQFETLHLSAADVRRFYGIYRQIDNDNSGTIGLPELLAHIDVEVTSFTESVFSIFDKDGSGELDFREFVISLWNYCTLSHVTLEYFAYNLYDYDNSGVLNVEEIVKMLQDIYGVAFKTNVYARQIADELVGKHELGNVTVPDFLLFCRNHQALLFPAFEMQRALQKNTMGIAFWERLIETREQLTEGEFVPVDKYLVRFKDLGDPKKALKKLAEKNKKHHKNNEDDEEEDISSYDPNKPKRNRNTDRQDKVSPFVSPLQSAHPSAADLRQLGGGGGGGSGTSTPNGNNTPGMRHNIPHSDFHQEHLLTRPVTDKLAHNSHAHKKKDYSEDHRQLHKVLMDKLYDTTVLSQAGGSRPHSTASSPQASPRQLLLAESFVPTLPGLPSIEVEARSAIFIKPDRESKVVAPKLAIPSTQDNQHYEALKKPPINTGLQQNLRPSLQQPKDTHGQVHNHHHEQQQQTQQTHGSATPPLRSEVHRKSDSHEHHHQHNQQNKGETGNKETVPAAKRPSRGHANHQPRQQR